MSTTFEGLFFEVRAETILIGQMILLVSINRIEFGMRQIGTIFEWLELFVFGRLDARVPIMEIFFQRRYNEVVLLGLQHCRPIEKSHSKTKIMLANPPKLCPCFKIISPIMSNVSNKTET